MTSRKSTGPLLRDKQRYHTVYDDKLIICNK